MKPLQFSLIYSTTTKNTLGLEWSIRIHIFTSKIIDGVKMVSTDLHFHFYSNRCLWHNPRHPWTEGTCHSSQWALRHWFKQNLTLNPLEYFCSLKERSSYFPNANVLPQIYLWLSVPSQGKLGGFTICIEMIRTKNFKCSYWGYQDPHVELQENPFS